MQLTIRMGILQSFENEVVLYGKSQSQPIKETDIQASWETTSKNKDFQEHIAKNKPYVNFIKPPRNGWRRNYLVDFNSLWTPFIFSQECDFQLRIYENDFNPLEKGLFTQKSGELWRLV